MTEPYYSDEAVTLYAGDCLDVLRVLPDESVDAVITDPPYGIGFMGQAWDQPGEYGSTKRNGKPGVHRRVAKCDHSTAREGAMEAGRYDFTANGRFQLWVEAWAVECLRVLKPGGHLLSFGSTRTGHRLASGIEDAGFEIRDGMFWLFGSGFPKNLDVGKAIDKAAGATREQVSLPTAASAYSAKAGNHRPWMDAAAANNGFRAVDGAEPVTDAARQWQGWGTALKPAQEPIVVARKPLVGTVVANVLAHGTGALNIDASRVPAQGRPLIVSKTEDSTGIYGHGLNGSSHAGVTDSGRWPSNVVLTHSQWCDTTCADGCPVAELNAQSGASVSRIGQPRGAAPGEGWGMSATGAEYADGVGASRFFPTFRYEAKAPQHERPRDADVSHPTVKPLDLMRWLVRLVTPPGGTVLEPFAGSGTTAEACVVEGAKCIAIEREAAYLPLIVNRVSKPIQVDMFGGIG